MGHIQNDTNMLRFKLAHDVERTDRAADEKPTMILQPDRNHMFLQRRY